jgi:dipeptidyl aminopeptidase/acylaminoacyl peptidase
MLAAFQWLVAAMSRILACCLLVLAVQPPVAAEPAPLTPESVLDLRAVAEAALSPDGAQVVYRMDRKRTTGEPLGPAVGELWSISAARGPARKLEYAGIDARQPQWSPDGAWIAWLSRRDLGSPFQVHVAARDDEAAVAVTNAAGGVVTFRWRPDSRAIAFSARDRESAEMARERARGRDWVVFGDPVAQTRLYTVQLRSRDVTLVTRADLTVHDFHWSPDGAHLVIAAAPTPAEDDHLLHTQPYVVAAAGGVPRLVARHRGRLSHPRWSADGKWLAWLASTDVTDPWAGTLFATAAHEGATPRAVTRDYAGSGVWLGSHPAHRGAMLFVGEEGQHTSLYSVDLEAGRMTALVRGDEVFGSDPSFSADGRRVAVAASVSAHPDEVFTGTLPAARLRRLTHSNPAMSPLALGAQSIVSWRSTDGLEIQGVLIRPVGFREGVRYPVVLHIHGGSEGVTLNGWQGSYRNWGQLLATRGYLVLYPNYRGSRGRGLAFVAGNRGDVMGREFEDILSGLDYLVAQGMADGERAAIYGFSWGGYAAAWGATYASKRFKAAVAGAGIYNWISEAGTSDTRMHEQLAHWDAPLYEHFPFYLERSPIYEVRRADTPILLLHGELDESCPVSQAIELHTALRWKGVPVELVIYPREGHGMNEVEHQRDFLVRGLGWLDRYVNGAGARQLPQEK